MREWPSARHKKLVSAATLSCSDDTISVIVKWSAKEYEIVVSNSGTVLCLKKAIEVQTGVKMARQKLLNLKCKGNHLQVLHE